MAKNCSYAGIRKQAARGKYASGGRVAASRTAGKTVINIITAPPAAGGMPAAGGPAPAPAPVTSPSGGGGPVPPAAAQMALSQMAGKPGGMFARGGRVKAGAESGVGRLQQAKREKTR